MLLQIPEPEHHHSALLDVAPPDEELLRPDALCDENSVLSLGSSLNDMSLDSMTNSLQAVRNDLRPHGLV